MIKFVGIPVSVISIVFILLSHNSDTEGFKQELLLFTTDGNSYYFSDDVLFITVSPLKPHILETVDRYCSRGIWDAYKIFVGWWGHDGHSPADFFYKRLGVGNESHFYCEAVDLRKMKSIHFVGSSNTDIDKIDFYPFPSQMGPAIEIKDPISINMYSKNHTLSLSSTGTTDWMLFEGPYLNGNFSCLTWKAGIYIQLAEVPDILPGGTVRSVAKGCSQDRIDFHRKQFIQALFVYTKDGRKHTFFDNVADVKTTGLDFAAIDTYCARGRWQLFEDTDFRNRDTKSLYLESICFKKTGGKVQSFRHWGAQDMSSDSLSLYSELNMNGAEILITNTVYENISVPIRSVAGTGAAPWTIFERPHFNGASVCISGAARGKFFHYDQKVFNLIDTIGSVIKGCTSDRQEDDSYLQEHSFETFAQTENVSPWSN